MEWFEHYGQPLDSYRLSKVEKGKADLALTIGADGDVHQAREHVQIKALHG